MSKHALSMRTNLSLGPILTHRFGFMYSDFVVLVHGLFEMEDRLLP